MVNTGAQKSQVYYCIDSRRRDSHRDKMAKLKEQGERAPEGDSTSPDLSFTAYSMYHIVLFKAQYLLTLAAVGDWHTDHILLPL